MPTGATGLGTAAPLRPAARPDGRRWAAIFTKSAGLLPGIAVAAVVAAFATQLGGLARTIGAPVVAIVSGMGLAALLPTGRALKPGVSFVSKKVLQASVVLLGTGLSLDQVLSAGARSLPVLVGTLVAALAMAWLAGRLLGLNADLRALIGVGTAICGASAVAATDAVIDADQADVSYAIATIFVFNVVAVLTYPSLGHLFGFSQRSFGLWAGTAINDVSSVVAASTIYGHAAASYAVIVKLTRTLAIVPISLGLAALRRRQQPGEASSGCPAGAPACPPVPSGRKEPGQARSGRLVGARSVFPMFVVVFLAAVLANTAGFVPASWHHGLADLATWMITAALAAIGWSADFGRARQAGLRPLALGAVLWATVGLTSLGLQALTGTL